MSENFIGNPRPLFQDDPSKIEEGTHRLKLGGSTAGIVIDVTELGMTINGYYRGFNDKEVFYANVGDSVEIHWDELKKVIDATKKKPQRKTKKEKALEPDEIDKPSKEYLKSLPVVTINKAKYYLDAEHRQRRPYERPHIVYNY